MAAKPFHSIQRERERETERREARKNGKRGRKGTAAALEERCRRRSTYCLSVVQSRFSSCLPPSSPPIHNALIGGENEGRKFPKLRDHLPHSQGEEEEQVFPNSGRKGRERNGALLLHYLSVNVTLFWCIFSRHALADIWNWTTSRQVLVIPHEVLLR